MTSWRVEVLAVAVRAITLVDEGIRLRIFLSRRNSFLKCFPLQRIKHITQA